MIESTEKGNQMIFHLLGKTKKKTMIISREMREQERNTVSRRKRERLSWQVKIHTLLLSVLGTNEERLVVIVDETSVLLVGRKENTSTARRNRRRKRDLE